VKSGTKQYWQWPASIRVFTVVVRARDRPEPHVEFKPAHRLSALNPVEDVVLDKNDFDGHSEID
jgi:hypothetical protein